MVRSQLNCWLVRLLICGFVIVLQASTLVHDSAALLVPAQSNTYLTASMALLHIALQEGFVKDSVIIRADQQEVFQQQTVTTRTQIGLAEWVEVTLPEGQTTLEVAVPSKGIAQTIPLQLSGNVYLGISITPDGRLEHQLSKEAFGYL